MKTAIIIFPGSNCDRDIKVAIKFCTGIEPLMIWHEDKLASKIDLVIIPGGFSYGDYLRSGSIAAQSPIMEDIVLKSNQGLPVVGICNGFQILTETGLLPGVLQQNKYLNFLCKNVFIKINNKSNKYFKNIKKNVLELHIAHNEGNYFCSKEELNQIKDNEQIAVTYCNSKGEDNEISNPNGAINNIAGIFNKEKNILGMMPHPERMIDKFLSGEDGSIFFQNLLNNLK